MKSKPLPPVEVLRSLFDYDPDTGDFRWKVRPANCVQIGDLITNKTQAGRPRVTLTYDGKKENWLCNRLAWAIHYGEDPGDYDIDHKNQNVADNSITNLRKATGRQNRFNSKGHSKGGVKYIYKDTKYEYYRVYAPGGVYLGQCNNLDDAIKMRDNHMENNDEAEWFSV